jgi:hypothetical protein
MRRRNRYLKIPRQQVYTAIRRELAANPKEWAAHTRNLERSDEPPPLLAGRRNDRGLEHVFTLLALVLDPDAVYLAMQASFSDDDNLRGTALEYLENVLPADMYDVLLLHLGSSHEGRFGQRSLGEIVRDLKSLVHLPHGLSSD